MSFLWHGLTEQGAQVPVQVDAQGRVIAVDGTPGVSNWERTGTTLSPAIAGDDISTTGDLSATAGRFSVNGTTEGTWIGQGTGGVKKAGYFETKVDAIGQIDIATFRGRVGFATIRADGSANFCTNKTDIGADGTIKIGGTLPSAPNITLNADGSATFAGNVTAANITFRSADPAFYVPNERSESYDGDTYTGPELNLLEEIVRLEALVKHLYDVLRQNPPAGWDVWDGDTDLIKSRGRRPHQ